MTLEEAALLRRVFNKLAEGVGQIAPGAYEDFYAEFNEAGGILRRATEGALADDKIKTMGQFIDQLPVDQMLVTVDFEGPECFKPTELENFEFMHSAQPERMPSGLWQHVIGFRKRQS